MTASRLRRLAFIVVSGIALVALSRGFLPVGTVLAAPPAQQVRSGGSLTSDLLLPGLFNQADTQRLPEPNQWWSNFPQMTVVGQGYTDSLPGERLYVGINWDTPVAGQWLRSTLVAFEDEATASAGLAGLLDLDLQAGGTEIGGPWLGDEARYFTQLSNDSRQTSVRFRLGPVISRLTVSTPDLEPLETTALASYAAGVVQRTRAILTGSLSPQPMPAALRLIAPAEAQTSAVGGLLGATAAPLVSWALVDNSGTPAEVLQRLEDYGAAADLGVWSYGVAADPDQSLTVVLFTFPDESTADRWVEEAIANPPPTTLDPGQTGSRTVRGFVDSNFGGLYTLQFRAGRYVVHVDCSSSASDTSAACDGAVRQMGEVWYSALSR